MGGLFSKPKIPKPPPLPDPLPIPEIDEEGVRKSVRTSKGRRYTRVTGELEPEIKKKVLLG